MWIAAKGVDSHWLDFRFVYWLCLPVETAQGGFALELRLLPSARRLFVQTVDLMGKAGTSPAGVAMRTTNLPLQSRPDDRFPGLRLLSDADHPYGRRP